ncbi:hypothetical protein B0H19DRAFT_1249183 [Mycena capillaripes]|nr:hypothetical protein B0H19DRAFT_1249183 [Mycena capillaripes]
MQYMTTPQDMLLKTLVPFKLSSSSHINPRYLWSRTTLPLVSRALKTQDFKLKPASSSLRKPSQAIDCSVSSWAHSPVQDASSYRAEGGDVGQGVVEPLLYRVIFVSTLADEMEGFPAIPIDILLNKIAIKPASFFESSVSHIFLDIEPTVELSVREVILTACTHVKDLFLLDTCDPQYLHSLGRFQSLTHLTMETRPLFTPGEIDFTAPLFRNLTHLEFLDDCEESPSDIGSSLALIPNLTHVAFNPDWDVPAIHALHARIRTNARLQCIVFFLPNLGFTGGPDSEDIRFVCIVQGSFRADWLRGAAAGKNSWALAEAFIAAKQA